MANPVGCIERKPTPQSVKFGGRYINLSAMARSQNMDQSYLSRVFCGKRNPTLDHSRKMAAALGMTMDQFLEALDERTHALRKGDRAIVKQYHTRVATEDMEDAAAYAAGKPVPPRMPGLRLPKA